MAGRFLRRFRRRPKLLAVASAPLPLRSRLELLQVGLRASGTWQEIPVEREADWPLLLDVVVDRDYEADYEDAFVVDCGAYKGFFGAYALARGAAGVVSYEPERVSFEALARAAGGRSRWRTVHAAVGARDAIARLPEASEAAPPDGAQPVRVLALSTVLARAAGEAAGRRLIVKLDLGGAELEAIAATPPEAWAPVSSALVAVRCEEDALRAGLAAAGLGLPERRGDVLHLERVAEAAGQKTPA